MQRNDFDEYDDGITFKRFLFMLYFLKLCEYQIFLSGFVHFLLLNLNQYVLPILKWFYLATED